MCRGSRIVLPDRQERGSAAPHRSEGVALDWESRCPQGPIGQDKNPLFSANFGPLKTELVRAPSLAIVLLLAATTLGVYKPWGLTRYGQRKQQERRKIQNQPEYKTP